MREDGQDAHAHREEGDTLREVDSAELGVGVAGMAGMAGVAGVESGASLAFVQVWPGDLGPLPFPDASFDVVIAQEAACQVHNKTWMFQEWFRVLRPGGRLSMMDWFAQVRQLMMAAYVECACELKIA
jgi:ubiquinone/menaquinone biosynthesis C-methylase UbiE